MTLGSFIEGNTQGNFTTSHVQALHNTTYLYNKYETYPYIARERFQAISSLTACIPSEVFLFSLPQVFDRGTGSISLLHSFHVLSPPKVHPSTGLSNGKSSTTQKQHIHVLLICPPLYSQVIQCTKSVLDTTLYHRDHFSCALIICM